MSEALGLRERKKNQTRQAISDAALALAVAHGPGAVTVDEIAVAANVSSRTVFNYFPNKEAAILGVNPERRLELLGCLEGRPAHEPPLVALREAFRELLTPDLVLVWRARAQLARDHPQLQSAYLAGFSGFEDDLTEVVARRGGLDASRDPYPRLVVAVAAAALRVAVDHAIDRRRTSDMGRIIDEAFGAVGAGLPPPVHRPAHH